VLIHLAGECPVGCGGFGLLVIADVSGSPVAYYCDDCTCAWRLPAAAGDCSTPQSLGILTARPASMPEIRSAGIATRITRSMTVGDDEISLFHGRA